MQGILLVAVPPSLVASYAVGWALDRGAPAVRTNMAVITVGTGVGECCRGPHLGCRCMWVERRGEACRTGMPHLAWLLAHPSPHLLLLRLPCCLPFAVFGMSYGAFNSTLAAWLLLPLMYTFVGAAFPLIGLPATRIYAPLERVTAFSFAYACSTGFLGGRVLGRQGLLCTAVEYGTKPAIGRGGRLKLRSLRQVHAWMRCPTVCGPKPLLAGSRPTSATPSRCGQRLQLCTPVLAAQPLLCDPSANALKFMSPNTAYNASPMPTGLAQPQPGRLCRRLLAAGHVGRHHDRLRVAAPVCAAHRPPVCGAHRVNGGGWRQRWWQHLRLTVHSVRLFVLSLLVVRYNAQRPCCTHVGAWPCCRVLWE